MTQELKKSMEAVAHSRKQAIEERKKADYSDMVYYVNAKVTGASNTISLIDSTTKKVAGITNFDGNVIGLGKAFPVSAMRVLYSTEGASEGAVNWQNREFLPAELQNAQLTLKQGKNILVSLPLTDLQNFKMKEFRMLATLPVLRDKEPFELEIEMPKNEILPLKGALQDYLRIEFKGVQRKSI